MVYSDKVLDHFENPRNVGSLDKSDPNVGIGIAGAIECGDLMKLSIKVEDGIIVDAKFKTFGCFGAGNVPISTPNGYKPISVLRPGDAVWAWNGVELVRNKISKVIKREVDLSSVTRVDFGHKGWRPVICSLEHIWWGADSKPLEASSLNTTTELACISENELRSLNNIGRTDWMPKLAAETMSKLMRLEKLIIVVFSQNQPGWNQSDSAKQKISEASLARWKNPTYIQNWKDGMALAQWKRPTLLEKKFISLFEKYNVDTEYVGDSKFWITCPDGSHLNPDFKVPHQKKVIEVYNKNIPWQDRTTQKTRCGPQEEPHLNRLVISVYLLRSQI